jgi:PEP-CTERM motif
MNNFSLPGGGVALRVLFLMFVFQAPIALAGDISFSLSSATLTASAGGTVSFDGTISNDSGGNLKASDFFFNFNGYDFSSVTPNQQLGVLSDFLIPNGSTSSVVELFDVTLGKVAAGSRFPIQVQLEDSNGDLSAVESVTVSAAGSGTPTPTPEPCTLWLFGSGLFGLAARRKLVQRARKCRPTSQAKPAHSASAGNSAVSRTPSPVSVVVVPLLIALLLAMVPAARAQAGPAISTQVATYSTSAGTFFVYLPLVNSGSATAGSVQVTSATLSTAKLLTPALPLVLGDLAASTTYGATLTFNGAGLTVGKNYLLTVRGTYQSAGNTLGFSVNRILSYGAASPFDQPANPLTVNPSLDTKHATRQLISAASGGTLTATGADGSVFTLTIPGHALLSDELITMTPLAALGGLPISGGLLAGVQLAPDGLQFQQAATLTIRPARSVPSAQQVGFGYHASGSEFYLQPLAPGGTTTLSLLHFSGAGVGQGSAGAAGNPSSPADQLAQQAAQAVNAANQCQGSGCSATLAQQLEGLLQEDYTQVVLPQAQQALSDASVAPTALPAMLGWIRMVMLLGFDADAPVDSEVQSLTALLPKIIENVYNTAYSECLNDTSETQRMAEGQTMIKAERTLQLLDSSAANANFSTEITACLAGPLDMSLISTMTANGFVSAGGGALTNLLAKITANSIPLSFDPTTLTYSGSGAASYDSLTATVNWLPPVSDCGSTFAGVSGVVEVKGQFDLNLNPLALSDLSQIVVDLMIFPQVSEIITLRALVPELGCKVTPPAQTNLFDALWVVADSVNEATLMPLAVNIGVPANLTLSETFATGGTVVEASATALITLTPRTP